MNSLTMHMSSRTRLRIWPTAALLVAGLSGCNTVVMNPAGDVAAQQAHLIAVSTALMLLIIVPVILLTLLFAWRYRQSNTEAPYTPDWDHSTGLELVIWGAPLLIIIALGLLTWINTHTLDPYRPLQRLDSAQPLPAGVAPLEIEVVAMDWKWLFVYPQEGVATVNEFAAPVGRPITFRITASTMMNSFYIPALAGQVYAMAGMQTQLHAVLNQPGSYDGFSANYSGAGFSDMRFKFLGLGQADFETWIARNRDSGGELSRARYLELERPSVRDAVQRFAKVDAGLFTAILNRCVDPSRMCMGEMMAIDAAGGMGPYTFTLADEARGGASAAGRRAGRHVAARLCTRVQSFSSGAPIASALRLR